MDISIAVNGQKETTAACTLFEYVTGKGLNIESLVVELNKKIIKQEQWQITHLKDNDELELLSFVGGG